VEEVDDSKSFTVLRLGVNPERRLGFELASISSGKEDVTLPICKGFWTLGD
jgi:hypothetical protein